MFSESGYTPPPEEDDSKEDARDNTITGSNHLPTTKEEWDKAMGLKSGEELREELDDIINS